MVAAERAMAVVAERPRRVLLRASVVLLAVAAVSKVTTLAADSFVAARFGLSVDADAYLVAVGLVGALLAAPSETVRLALIPICGSHLREGRLREAAGVVAWLLAGAAVFGGAAALVLVVALPWLAPLVAPGFDSHGREILNHIMVVLAIAVVLGLLMSVLLGVLHTQLRFGAPAVAGIGLSGGVIGGGVLLGHTLGITSLAVGYVVGMGVVTAMLAWLSRGLFRDGASLDGARRELRPFLRLAVPTGFAISIVSLGAIVERAVASVTGAGNVAALGFAIKLITQAGVISQSIWTPLTPLLTASGASSQHEGDPRLVVFSLRLLLLTLVPATALIIALRQPLVAVIFQRGAFTAADTTTTANLLALHSGSLVGEGMFMVAVAALLSLHDSGTRLIAAGCLIGAKVLLIAVLAPLVGVAGVAVAASLSSLLAGGYALRVLGRLFSQRERRALHALGGKVLVAGLGALAAAAATSRLLTAGSGGAGLGGELLQLIAGGLAGTLVFLGALTLLRVEEVNTLLCHVQERLRGRNA